MHRCELKTFHPFTSMNSLVTADGKFYRSTLKGSEEPVLFENINGKQSLNDFSFIFFCCPDRVYLPSEKILSILQTSTTSLRIALQFALC